jgi:serine phosphatase RsbU (regulator of sigma subunit)
MSVGKARLLVVEQPAEAESELTRLLQGGGFVTTNVTTEGECLSKIRAALPDLVLLSLPNEQVDANSLILEILEFDADLPILLVSIEGQDENIANLMEVGATDFFRIFDGQGALLRYAVEKNIELRRRQLQQRISTEKAEELNLRLVESLKILERDQQAGFRVQQGMMPTSPSTIGQVTFDHKVFPSLILSGDFIDYFKLPDDRVLFYIADVSGHGASSAFVTVLLKSLSMRLQIEFHELDAETPGEILAWLNRELLQCDLEQHVTMFLGIIDCDKNLLEYSNAAQFPAAILSGEDGSQFLEIGGLPLGLYQSPEYDSRAVSLPSRFSIVMFSDGVFEIMPQQTLKAKEEHLLSVVKCENRNVEALAEQLGIANTRNVPDDIAVFTVAGVG